MVQFFVKHCVFVARAHTQMFGTMNCAEEIGFIETGGENAAGGSNTEEILKYLDVLSQFRRSIRVIARDTKSELQQARCHRLRRGNPVCASEDLELCKLKCKLGVSSV